MERFIGTTSICLVRRPRSSSSSPFVAQCCLVCPHGYIRILIGGAHDLAIQISPRSESDLRDEDQGRIPRDLRCPGVWTLNSASVEGDVRIVLEILTFEA